MKRMMLNADDELSNLIVASAAKNRRSISGEIAWLLDFALTYMDNSREKVFTEKEMKAMYEEYAKTATPVNGGAK